MISVGVFLFNHMQWLSSVLIIYVFTSALANLIRYCGEITHKGILVWLR